jgi:glutathione S-transferase
MLTVHGVARGRPSRCLPSAGEAGVDRRHDPVPSGPEGSKGAAVLAPNPNGGPPAMADGPAAPRARRPRGGG